MTQHDAPGWQADAAFVPARAAHGRRSSAVVLLAFGLFAVSILVFVVGLAFGVRGEDVPLLVLASVMIVAGAIPLLMDQARLPERRHVLLSMIAIVFMVQFVVPVLAIYIPAVGPADPSGMSGANLLPSDISRAQAISLAGLLALYLGYALPLGSGLAALMPRPRHEWTHQSVLLASVILIPVGWVVYASAEFGLLPARLGSGVLGGVANLSLFGISLLTVAYIRYRSRPALLLLMVLVPLTMLANFFTGSKRMILSPPALVAMTWIVMQRRIRARWIAAGVLALLVLYPVAQFWRDDILVHNTLRAADILRNPGPAVARTLSFVTSARPASYLAEGLEATSYRLDAIGKPAVIIRDTPGVSPFQNGRTLAAVPLGFVPRVIWPDKPDITIGQWITETYRIYGERIDSRIGPSWIGEFYLNFGTAGVLVGMFLLGALLRLVHATLFHPNATIPMVVAGVVVLYKVTLKLQGGIVSAINGPIISLLPLVGIHVLLVLVGGTIAVRAARGGEVPDRGSNQAQLP